MSPKCRLPEKTKRALLRVLKSETEKNNKNDEPKDSEKVNFDGFTSIAKGHDANATQNINEKIAYPRQWSNGNNVQGQKRRSSGGIQERVGQECTPCC